ncbi:MAG: hypothetical protein JXN61_04845 [Sedimentisphaerales bacterium]|nr:hypothetical protein [Sedimentisphaerales bacterium]
MSGTGNCRFVWDIAGRTMKRTIVSAILAVLIFASSPATGETMNLGTARFTGLAYSYDEEGVELWFGGRMSRTVSWFLSLEDVEGIVYISTETSAYFETMASTLSNGINNVVLFDQKEGTECDTFTKNSGASSEYCDFCGYDITAMSLTVHSLTANYSSWTYDVTLTIWGEILVPAATYYVDADANGLNDGSSWADAYNFLQDALADANSSSKPAEIRVAQGVYSPDSNSAAPEGTGDREATFQLVNSVIIKGGYAGPDEPDPYFRDVELYKTVLSGDLGGDDGLAFQNNGENSYSVVTGSSTDGRAVLDGFTIIGGNADVDEGDTEGSAFSSGGGMFSIFGSPMVRNCTFEWNQAKWAGGGMCNYNNSHPTVINCTFRCCEADQSSGGMRNHTSSSPTVTNCTFTENSSFRGTGGMSNAYSCDPTVTHCIFSQNTGRHGGGMTIANGNVGALIANCIFSGNRANISGALMILNSEVTVTNCIFIGNIAVEGSGAIQSHYGEFINCIVYGNRAEYGWVIEGDAEISYSNIEGGWPGEGNIDADPCFADPGFWHHNRTPDDLSDDFWVDGDYHLKSEAGRWARRARRWIKDDVTSSCIDAGDPNAEWTAELWPHGKRINIGAYGGTSEASMSPSIGGNAADFDCDGVVNVKDLSMLASVWGSDELLLKEDITRNGLISFPDFAKFAEHWLWEQ